MRDREIPRWHHSRCQCRQDTAWGRRRNAPTMIDAATVAGRSARCAGSSEEPEAENASGQPARSAFHCPKRPPLLPELRSGRRETTRSRECPGAAGLLEVQQVIAREIRNDVRSRRRWTVGMIIAYSRTGSAREEMRSGLRAAGSRKRLRANRSSRQEEGRVVTSQQRRARPGCAQRDCDGAREVCRRDIARAAPALPRSLRRRSSCFARSSGSCLWRRGRSERGRVAGVELHRHLSDRHCVPLRVMQLDSVRQSDVLQVREI